MCKICTNTFHHSSSIKEESDIVDIEYNIVYLSLSTIVNRLSRTCKISKITVEETGRKETPSDVWRPLKIEK